MEAALILAGIDYAIKGVTALVNATGAQSVVGSIVARRLAENRADWTAEEKAEIEQAMTDAKAYAAAQLGLGGEVPPKA